MGKRMGNWEADNPEHAPLPTTAEIGASLQAAQQSITARDVLATVIDTFALDGVPLHARTKGILARQAKEGLGSGFDPDTVLRACVISTRRGEPQNAWRIMGDLALLAAGKHMDRREYENELRAEKVRMTRKPNAVERFLGGDDSLDV